MDEQLQQQIVQLVQAAISGDQQASQQIQQIMQAAQQGDQQAAQVAQMIQAVAQQMQNQQVQAAKRGAKLNYIKNLRGQCPAGTELQYFKSGGRVCSKCVAQQVAVSEMKNIPQDPIEAFKCGRKMKKAQKGVQLKKTKTVGDPYNNTTTRTWSDGTTSKREVTEDGVTMYQGRNGEVGFDNGPSTRQQAVADSLKRADWNGKTAPILKKKVNKHYAGSTIKALKK